MKKSACSFLLGLFLMGGVFFDATLGAPTFATDVGVDLHRRGDENGNVGNINGSDHSDSDSPPPRHRSKRLRDAHESSSAHVAVQDLWPVTLEEAMEMVQAVPINQGANIHFKTSAFHAMPVFQVLLTVLQPANLPHHTWAYKMDAGAGNTRAMILRIRPKHGAASGSASINEDEPAPPQD